MASNASFGFDGSMFVNKGTLLVHVTLKACRISASGKPRLLQFKTTVRVMAIAALHHTFQHLVMERQLKLVLRFAVTAHTELRFAGFE
jgi:hypothetical protein